MPAQRSPAILLAVGALAVLAVVVLFQVVLEAPPHDPCSTSLASGPFRVALVPAHLSAAAILIGCLYGLGASRRGLAAVAAFALLCLIVPAVFVLVALVALIAAQLLVYLAIPALLICTVVVLRTVRDPAERRAALTSTARVALWLGLVIALPANLAFAWLSGVSLFCF